MTTNTDSSTGATSAPSVPRVPVKSLNGVTIGTSEAAQLCKRILQSYGDVSLDAGLQRLALSLHVGPWTVYRWLGDRSLPRAAQLHALREIAKRHAA